MKRITIYSSFLVLLLFALTGCYRDIIYPATAVDPNGPPQFVSFKADLIPIFSNNCAKATCHVSGSVKPYLTSDIAYLQLTGGGFVNILVPNQSIIYQMINGDMQPNIPSAKDRQKIYDWIRNGAPNN